MPSRPAEIPTRAHAVRGHTGTSRSALSPGIDELVTLAVRGLSASFLPEANGFAQTVRAVRTPQGVGLVREGMNIRYAAMVALGLATVDQDSQQSALPGLAVVDLTAAVRAQAASSTDLGAVALAAWAAAEVAAEPDLALLDRLDVALSSWRPVPTVITAWMLTAAVASLRASPDAPGPAAHIAALARDRLLAAQGPEGIFPAALPAVSLGRWRAHVGCFADQVYPIQALARFAALMNDQEALAGANLAAQRICELQGEAGQWWWHYDARNGAVVEGYPVYSVHQHGMAPMALFDLADSGGDDHTPAILRGLGWLESHPEVLDDLVSERRSQVWRKVGRREPAKAARKLSAVTTSLRPGLRLPGMDALLPPNQIDHECRPYELGWLIYAWHFGDAKETEAPS